MSLGPIQHHAIRVRAVAFKLLRLTISFNVFCSLCSILGGTTGTREGCCPGSGPGVWAPGGLERRLAGPWPGTWHAER